MILVIQGFVVHIWVPSSGLFYWLASVVSLVAPCIWCRSIFSVPDRQRDFASPWAFVMICCFLKNLLFGNNFRFVEKLHRDTWLFGTAHSLDLLDSSNWDHLPWHLKFLHSTEKSYYKSPSTFSLHPEESFAF